jgi:hypothetical protein
MKVKDGKTILFGILILALGAWVTFSEGIIKGGFSRAMPFLALPTTYLRLVGWALMILSLLLILTNVTFNKDFHPAPTKLKASKTVVLSFVALLIYVFAMNKIGFFISSLILTGLLCFIYQYYDRRVESSTQSVGILVGYALISFVFALVSVSVLQFVFTGFLNANLPKFQLF